jgi:hypothetical protein
LRSVPLAAASAGSGERTGTCDRGVQRILWQDPPSKGMPPSPHEMCPVKLSPTPESFSRSLRCRSCCPLPAGSRALRCTPGPSGRTSGWRAVFGRAPGRRAVGSASGEPLLTAGKVYFGRTRGAATAELRGTCFSGSPPLTTATGTDLGDPLMHRLQPLRQRVKHFHEAGDIHEFTFSCFRRTPLLTNNTWQAGLSNCPPNSGRRPPETMSPEAPGSATIVLAADEEWMVFSRSPLAAASGTLFKTSSTVPPRRSREKRKHRRNAQSHQDLFHSPKGLTA